MRPAGGCRQRPDLQHPIDVVQSAEWAAVQQLVQAGGLLAGMTTEAAAGGKPVYKYASGNRVFGWLINLTGGWGMRLWLVIQPHASTLDLVRGHLASSVCSFLRCALSARIVASELAS